MCRAVASPVVVGLVASTTSRIADPGVGYPARRARSILRSSGSTPSIGDRAPAEDVVEAVELVGALHRDHVGGLLDDADHRGVATGVLADAAAWFVGEVEADLAQADLLLDLLDRLGQAPRRPRRRPAGCGRPALGGTEPTPGSLDSSVTSRWTGGAKELKRSPASCLAPAGWTTDVCHRARARAARDRRDHRARRDRDRR